MSVPAYWFLVAVFCSWNDSRGGALLHSQHMWKVSLAINPNTNWSKTSTSTMIITSFTLFHLSMYVVLLFDSFCESSLSCVSVPGPCDPEDLIDGIIFAANYLGSTQLLSDKTPSKNVRMMQAQEAVSRIKVNRKRLCPEWNPEWKSCMNLRVLQLFLVSFLQNTITKSSR